MTRSVATQAQGFTLVEIMVVVVILGVLSAVIVPNIIGRPDEARVVAARSEVQAIGNALEFYRLDNGFYPSSEQGLEALVSKPSGEPSPANWSSGGYLKKLPEDPWGQPYRYVNENRFAEVYSYGADRKEGGEGVDQDIKLSEL